MDNQPNWKKKVPQLIVPILLLILLWLSIGVTKPDLKKLVTSAPKAKQILNELLKPDILEKQSGTFVVSLPLPVPCGSAPEEASTSVSDGILQVVPGCANPRDKVMLKGSGLGANVSVKLRWILPSKQLFSIREVKSDSAGNLLEEIDVRPITATKDGVASKLEAEISMPSNKYVVAKTLMDVFNAMYITVFMSLLATTAGTLFSLPLSFLAASNITKKGPVGTAVYYLVRGFLNLIRSYEPLVMATVFALIVGFGSPFAGVLALSIVTAASLGKMFSESVESIDPGPIEALQSVGANAIQVVRYAVIPQIIPDFLSFTIYHWDINVRISTIIGFVGGGGIGYFLSQRINSFEYSKAGTAILAIILVVWTLDFLSSEIRKQLV